MAFHPFPRLNADLFTLVDGRLTATAIILNLRDGQTPHGAATGVNLTGTPHLGEPIESRAFFLQEEDFRGWHYVDAINGQRATIYRSRTKRGEAA